LVLELNVLRDVLVVNYFVGFFGRELAASVLIIFLHAIGQFDEAVADKALCLGEAANRVVLLKRARVKGPLLPRLRVQVHLLEELVRLLQGPVLLLQDLAVVLHAIESRLQQPNLSVQSLLVHVLLHEERRQLQHFARGITLAHVDRVHVYQVHASRQVCLRSVPLAMLISFQIEWHHGTLGDLFQIGAKLQCSLMGSLLELQVVLLEH